MTDSSKHIQFSALVRVGQSILFVAVLLTLVLVVVGLKRESKSRSERVPSAPGAELNVQLDHRGAIGAFV
jgi:hypothetical protein